MRSPWQQQAHTVGPRRTDSTGMAQHRHDPVQIRREPLLAGPQSSRNSPRHFLYVGPDK